MSNFSFRNLHAGEIDVRINEVRQNGVTLLLYKNARCDMAILDETVGPMGWQREHYECKGNLFCRVGMLDDGGCWVWKSDAGKKSSYEAEKGEASDSFKRACTNWGIGRELYTAPRIWLPADRASIRQNNNGKWVCYDRFSIAKCVIESHQMKALAVRNDTSGRIVFTWMAPDFEPEEKREHHVQAVADVYPDAEISEVEEF